MSESEVLQDVGSVYTQLFKERDKVRVSFDEGKDLLRENVEELARTQQELEDAKKWRDVCLKYINTEEQYLQEVTDTQDIEFVKHSLEISRENLKQAEHYIESTQHHIEFILKSRDDAQKIFSDLRQILKEVKQLESEVDRYFTSISPGKKDLN